MSLNSQRIAGTVKDTILKNFLPEIRERVDPLSVIYNIQGLTTFNRQVISCECKNNGPMSGAVKLQEELTRASYLIFHQFLNALYNNTSNSLLAIQIGSSYVKELLAAEVIRDTSELRTFCELDAGLRASVLDNIQPGQHSTSVKSSYVKGIPPVQATGLDDGELHTGNRKKPFDFTDEDDLYQSKLVDSSVVANIYPSDAVENTETGTPGTSDESTTHAAADNIGETPTGFSRFSTLSADYDNTLARIETVSIEDNTFHPQTLQESDKAKQNERKEDNLNK